MQTLLGDSNAGICTGSAGVSIVKLPSAAGAAVAWRRHYAYRILASPGERCCAFAGAREAGAIQRFSSRETSPRAGPSPACWLHSEAAQRDPGSMGKAVIVAEHLEEVLQISPASRVVPVPDFPE